MQHYTLKPQWKPKRKSRVSVFKTPEEFEEAAEQYLEYCFSKTQIISFIGFANFCGCTHRAIMRYKEKEEYKEIYYRFKTIVHQSFQDGALTDRMNLGMVKIILKQNFGVYYEKGDADPETTDDKVVNITFNTVTKD